AFATEAVIWQNTGEDWRSVDVSLSTERPSLGAEPPRLEDDALSVTRKGALVVETREQQIEQAGLGAAAPGGAAASGERPRSEGGPGTEDGGAALSLGGAPPADVASDSRPCAVPLFTFQSKVDIQLEAAPELACAVLTKTTFENTSGRPLLAGPVELVRN